MDKITALLQGFANLQLSPAVMATLAVVVEFVLHLTKSDKPVGLIHTVSGVLVRIAAFVALIGTVVGKVAGLIDQVVPQTLTTPIDTTTPPKA